MASGDAGSGKGVEEAQPRRSLSENSFIETVSVSRLFTYLGQVVKI